jgi:transposase
VTRAGARKPVASLGQGSNEPMVQPRKYPDELREQAVELVLEGGRSIAEVSRELTIGYETLRRWVREREAEAVGVEPPLRLARVLAQLGELQRENRELRQTNEMLLNCVAHASQRLG